MRHRQTLLFALLLIPACGPTTVTLSADGTPDGGSVDAGGDAAGQDSGDGDSASGGCPAALPDPGLADAAAPTGTLLRGGDALSVRGVTSDGYVIYSDDAAQSLHAIALAGGSPVDLGALGDKFWVVVAGNVVFIWSNVTAANVGALSTWSTATGVHAISTASLGLVASASPAGDHILYVDNVNPAGETGDIVGAAVDGSGASSLVAGAFVAGCSPEIGFVGSYAVVSHCDSAVGASPSATISSFSLDTAARADLATSSENYWASSGASDVLVSTNGVGVRVVPVAGGDATLIDAAGFLGVLESGGNVALYGTKSGELRRSPVASPSPSTLVSSGFGGFWALSPDEQWTLYFSGIGAGGGDIYMASTAAPGPPVALSPSRTGVLRGDAFTANSSHVVYSTGFDPCTGSATLDALAIGTSSPRALGNQSWMNRAVGGSKIVFTDNFVATTDTRFGRADVEYIDLAQAAPPTRLADRADAVIGVSPAGDQLVYVWSARPGSLAGLYVTSIP